MDKKRNSEIKKAMRKSDYLLSLAVFVITLVVIGTIILSSSAYAACTYGPVDWTKTGVYGKDKCDLLWDQEDCLDENCGIGFDKCVNEDGAEVSSSNTLWECKCGGAGSFYYEEYNCEHGCVDGECLPECERDDDCDGKKKCVDYECKEVECKTNEDCNLGILCVNYECNENGTILCGNTKTC